MMVFLHPATYKLASRPFSSFLFSSFLLIVDDLVRRPSVASVRPFYVQHVPFTLLLLKRSSATRTSHTSLTSTSRRRPILCVQTTIHFHLYAAGTTKWKSIRMNGGGEESSSTKDLLKKELLKAEKALARVERTRQALSSSEVDGAFTVSASDQILADEETDPVSRLAKLYETTELLKFSGAFADWVKSLPDEEDIFKEAQACERLAVLIVQRGGKNLGNLIFEFFESKYLPLYQYCISVLQASVRHDLERNNYPKPEACDALIQSEGSSFVEACMWLSRLENANAAVLDTLDMGEEDEKWNRNQSSIVLKELFRPILDRVRYHFVEPSPERLTTTKTDRLPEFFLNYVREHFLEDGPWNLVQKGLAPKINGIELEFLNELIRMIAWVLLDERDFFRHSTIAGPESNPLLLCSAIEQVLKFDDCIRKAYILPLGSDQTQISLFDTLVGKDHELCRWWIQREHESVFSMFTDDTAIPTEAVNHISPRAEIFTALIRSIQMKASIMVDPAPYLRGVALPLCTSFIDAIHEASVELKKQLSTISSPDKPFDTNRVVRKWVELINGTNFAAATLLRNGAWLDNSTTNQQSSDTDLARFGRSLERLGSVLIDEFATMFVDTVLMKRAKLANYLMIISSVLSSSHDELHPDSIFGDFERLQLALSLFLHACDAESQSIESDDTDETGIHDAASSAPSALKIGVVIRLAEKFEEIFLDPTLAIGMKGALIVQEHTKDLFSKFMDMKRVQRLVEVADFAAAESALLESLRTGLQGLLGSNSPTVDVLPFISDPTLLTAAEAMIAAKGVRQITLEEVISIINRREP